MSAAVRHFFWLYWENAAARTHGHGRRGHGDTRTLMEKTGQLWKKYATVMGKTDTYGKDGQLQ